MIDLSAIFQLAASEVASADAGLKQWWSKVISYLDRDDATGAWAVLCGAAAPSLNHTFVAGYRCALQALVPGRIDLGDLVSFGVTEENGGHPRAIETTLTKRDDVFLLNGVKTWSTMAPEAESMFVLADTQSGSPEKKSLVLVEVSLDSAGVTIEPKGKTPFLPLVPHARVTFSDTIVLPDQLLPGDGYNQYSKPFRTIEDIHILCAGFGYLVRTGRKYNWDRVEMEELFSLITAAVCLSSQMPQLPSTHLALSGLFAQFTRFVSDLPQRVDDQVFVAEWQRDAVVFGVAGKAREARRQRAWDSVLS